MLPISFHFFLLLKGKNGLFSCSSRSCLLPFFFLSLFPFFFLLKSLRFFYRQELVCDSENALSVLAVADHFQVSPLKLHAVHVLLKALLEESEDIDLLLLLLNFARGSRCAYLGDFCLEFLARCYDRIWLNPLFLEMSAESLSEVGVHVSIRCF